MVAFGEATGNPALFLDGEKNPAGVAARASD